MRRVVAVCAIAVIVVLALEVPAPAKTTVRTLTETVSAEEADWLFVELPVGRLEAIGTSGESVRIVIEVNCEDRRSARCRDVARDIELDVNRRSYGIEIEVDGWPKHRSKGLSLEGRLEVPRRLALEIEMGVGDVFVSDAEDDLEIDLGVGHASIEMPESAVRSENLDAGVGEVTLQVGGRNIEGSGFIGHGLNWRDGPGRAHLEINCGVGSIEVYLDYADTVHILLPTGL